MNYQTIEIKKPIWDKRKIGINPNKITSSQMYRIECTWKLANGARMYPNPFYARGRQIQEYEAQTFVSKKYGPFQVHVVPIADLSTELPGSDICLEHNAIKLPSGECWVEVPL